MKAGSGVRTFLVIWAGQAASLIGTAMTSFALGVEVYRDTGSTTQFALVLLFTELPPVVLAPVAGALVDRWDRRWAMILADSSAALVTLMLAALVVTGRLEVWQVWLAAAASSTCNTLQLPAFAAATSLLVPKRHFARAHGLMQLGHFGTQILALSSAGFILAAVGLAGVLAFDFVTFLVALATLLAVRFPAPEATAEGGAGRGSLWREAAGGGRFILHRPGLLRLLAYFALFNFTLYAASALLPPLVLSFADERALGVILGVGTAGGLAGSALMTAWGGPRRRVLGVLGGGFAGALAIAATGLAPSPLLVGGGLFAAFFTLPILSGCSQAVWQAKTPPDLQGRVFALRGMVAGVSGPAAYLAAGPLADRVFTPLLTAGGPLAGSVGRLLGVGPGRGIGLLLVVVGLLGLAAPLLGALSPRLRRLEQELPDRVEEPGPERAVPAAGSREGRADGVPRRDPVRP